jgi:hypothetical protein
MNGVAAKTVSLTFVHACTFPLHHKVKVKVKVRVL